MRRGHLILLVATSISVLTVRALREEICDFIQTEPRRKLILYADAIREYFTFTTTQQTCIYAHWAGIRVFAAAFSNIEYVRRISFNVHKQYVLIEIM